MTCSGLFVGNSAQALVDDGVITTQAHPLWMFQRSTASAAPGTDEDVFPLLVGYAPW